MIRDGKTEEIQNGLDMDKQKAPLTTLQEGSVLKTQRFAGYFHDLELTPTRKS